MTNYSVTGQTLTRLAKIIAFTETSLPIELRNQINCIRLENRSGITYAVATNGVVAGIERIGVTDQPDGCCHLKIDPMYMNYQGKMTITTIPMIALATMQFDSGVILNDVCNWYDSTPLNEWRNWVPDVSPSESKGAMYWNMFHVEALLSSSPSGEVIFPCFIDVEKPIILRDCHSTDWFGLFIPAPRLGQSLPKPATVPEWFTK